MDAGSEELIGDMSNAIKFIPSPKTKVLARKAKPFILKEGMHKVGQDNIMHICLTNSKAHIVLKELHGVAGKHFAMDITTKKILDVGYWWPTLFKDIHEFCKSYDIDKKIGKLKTKNLAKLLIIILK